MAVLILLSLSFAAEEWAIPPEVLDAAEESRNLPIGLRMKAVTEPMLGLPYVVDGIGEDRAPDRDPLVRYDSYDCLTFVEEALALSLTADPVSVPALRNSLRYSGEVDYFKRNHFMVSQWIPNALENGILEDITSRHGEVHLVTKTIIPRNWARWKGRWNFHLTAEDYPLGQFTLGVLSLDAVADALPVLPDGALLVVVRQNRSYNPVLVTHIGFLVRDAEGVKIRHATKMGDKVVRDDRLPWYFEHIMKFDNWPVEGILVLMPREQGPRRISMPMPSEGEGVLP
jgi:hypothetical protein